MLPYILDMVVVSLRCNAAYGNFDYFRGIPVQLSVAEGSDLACAKKRLDASGVVVSSIHLDRANPQNDYLARLIRDTYQTFGAKRYTLHPSTEDVAVVNELFTPLAEECEARGIKLSFENQANSKVWLRDPYDIRKVAKPTMLTLDIGHLRARDVNQVFNDLKDRIAILHLSGREHSPYFPSDVMLADIAASNVEEVVLEFGQGEIKKQLRRGIDTLLTELRSAHP